MNRFTLTVAKGFTFATMLFSCALLTACNLTEEDKQRIDDAEGNLQKVALDPKIISPSNDEVVSGVVDVIVDLDNSVEYEKVTLQVGTTVIEGNLNPLGNASFSFDTGLFADKQKVTLLAKAYMLNGNLLRSNTISVSIGDQAHIEVSDPKIISPSNDETVSGVVEVIVDLDTSVEYEKVILQIGSKIIEENPNRPGTFSVDTYFLADQQKVTLLAKAFMVNGNQLRSEAISVAISDDAGNALRILSPIEGDSVAKDANVSVQWTAIPSATAYEYQIDDQSPIKIADTSVDVELADIAKHSLKVRALDDDGNAGVWSDAVRFTSGLFAFAYDIKTSDWPGYDDPVDLLINENDFVLLSTGSDLYSDGSGDSSNVTVLKVDEVTGTPLWNKSYSQFIYPTSISPATNGYLITGRSDSRYSGAVFKVNDAGDVSWVYTAEGMPSKGDGSGYSQELIYAGIELPNGNVLLSRTSIEWEEFKNKPSQAHWSSRVKDKVISFEFIDPLDNSSSQTIITQPVSGEYSNINQMLLTDSGLYAAGRYTTSSVSNDGSSDSYSPISSSGSGTVLFEFNSMDGSLLTDKTKIGGGIGSSNPNELVQDLNGNMLVSYDSYNRAGVTKFNAGTNTSEFISEAQRNGHIAVNSLDGGFAIAGSAKSSNAPARVSLYSNSYSRLKEFWLSDYSNDLSIKAIKYDEDYGYIVLATEKGSLNFGNGTYTVMFNISDDGAYTVPKKLTSLR